MSEYEQEETPWDRFKREQEENEGAVPFHSFPVYRYQFLDGPRKGEDAFDLYQLPDSGKWKMEPFDSDIREECFTTDELIDFMQKLNIQPPTKDNEVS